MLVTAYNDSLTKTIAIMSRNSFAYWLNAWPNWHLWTGFYIDTKTKKRFTYPKTVFIDLNLKDSSYLTYIPLSKKYDVYENTLKITPLKTIALLNPSLELSYERRTGRSFSTQLTASCLLPISIMDLGASFKPSIRGFSAAVEEKYYLKKSAPLGAYVGLELNYLNVQQYEILNFTAKNNNQDTINRNYSDTFRVKKQTYSFNIKFGYQVIVKRMAIDLYAGLGLRYKDVAHFDRLDPQDPMALPRHPNIYYLANRNGKYWTVSIPLNMRIGWRF